MEQVLLVVHVLIAAALIGIILLQRSESDGLGLGGGSNSNIFSGRGTATLLTRATAILAAAFMGNALLLAVMAANNKPASIVETIEQQQTDVAPAVEKNAEAPAVVEKKAPQVPAADATPAVKKKVVKPAAEEAPVDEMNDKDSE